MKFLLPKFLLTVARQHLLAALADLRTIGLQASEHKLVAFLHLSPAVARDIARTGVLALIPILRGLGHGSRRDQDERDSEKKLDHVLCFHIQKQKRDGSITH
jgi:hypothetical protein